MSLVHLRKLEVIVDRVHSLCGETPSIVISKALESATESVSSVNPAKGKIDAVETLVKRACDKTMYNFVSLSGMHIWLCAVMDDFKL